MIRALVRSGRNNDEKTGLEKTGACDRGEVSRVTVTSTRHHKRRRYTESCVYLPQLVEEKAIHGVPCRGNHILMTIQRVGLRCVGNVAGAHSPERRTRCCV